MGEIYNNLFYGVLDEVNPESNINFGNYFSYFNYNAEASASIKNTAENQNSLSSSSWQESDVVVTNHGIVRTGTAGNRFYAVADDSPFRNVGRYGDNIGGFSWAGLTDITSPSAPQNLSVN